MLMRRACRQNPIGARWLCKHTSVAASRGPESSMVAKTYRVSIDTIPLPSQRDAWQEALSSMMLDCRLPATGSFHSGELAAKSSRAGVRLALLRSTAQEILYAGSPDRGAPPPLVIAFHAYGRGTINGGRRTCEFADGDISVCDLQADWGLMLRDDFEILLLELPRERLFGRLGHNRFRLPTVLGATNAAAATRSLMRSLADNFDTMDQADLATVEV